MEPSPSSPTIQDLAPYFTTEGIAQADEELCGFRVWCSVPGIDIGEVQRVEPGPAHAYLCVQGSVPPGYVPESLRSTNPTPPAQHLIPWVAQMVRGIDVQHATVTVDLPGGLLDLGYREALLEAIEAALLPYTSPPSGSVAERLGRRMMPTRAALRAAGRRDLLAAIDRAGGSKEVAAALGLAARHRPPGYWESPENLEREISAFVAASWVYFPAVDDEEAESGDGTINEKRAEHPCKAMERLSPDGDHPDTPSLHQQQSSAMGRESNPSAANHSPLLGVIRPITPRGSVGTLPSQDAPNRQALRWDEEEELATPADLDADSLESWNDEEWAEERSDPDAETGRSCYDDTSSLLPTEEDDSSSPVSRQPSGYWFNQVTQRVSLEPPVLPVCILLDDAGTELLVGEEDDAVLPSRDTLAAAGRYDLIHGIQTLGGHRAAAEALGRTAPAPRHRHLDGPGRLERELYECCEEQGWDQRFLPPAPQLLSVGRPDLHSAVLRLGGYAEAARKLGRRTHRSARNRWSNFDTAVAEFRAYMDAKQGPRNDEELGGRQAPDGKDTEHHERRPSAEQRSAKFLPARGELKRAGRTDLLYALVHYGAPRLATALGVAVRPRGGANNVKKSQVSQEDPS